MVLGSEEKARATAHHQQGKETHPAKNAYDYLHAYRIAESGDSIPL
ncbi:MAG: hypothetical protein VB997_10705 [Opitutales bacterium]